jgi:hypothetical protein
MNHDPSFFAFLRRAWPAAKISLVMVGAVVLTSYLISILIPDLRFPLNLSTPSPVPSRASDFQAALDRAAASAPFALLVPDASALSFPLIRSGVEVLPASDDAHYTVVQHFTANDAALDMVQAAFYPGEMDQAPLKSIGQTSVRGMTAYWLVLNTGVQSLYWRERDSAVTILGDLPDQDKLALAEALVPYQSGAKAPLDCSQVFPGLPGCLSDRSLVGGLLALNDAQGRLGAGVFLADLKTGALHLLSRAPGRLLGWSPSKNYLLVLRPDANPNLDVYRVADGSLAAQYTLLSGEQPIWLPPDTLGPGVDWLALPSHDGALLAVAVPGQQSVTLLPPGALLPPEEGIGRPVVVSRGGWLAWMSSATKSQGEPSAPQTLTVRRLAAQDVRIFNLDPRAGSPRFALLDWDSGDNHILFAGLSSPSAAENSAGIPLYSLDVDTGELRSLDVRVASLADSYAWFPYRSGLLAVAEMAPDAGDGFGRLAIIDLYSGDKRYLTEPLPGLCTPVWATDTSRIAVLIGAPSGPSRILSLNQYSGEEEPAIAPEIETMGWLRWSADGQKLLYARQREAGALDVRVLDLATGADDLLLTGFPVPECPGGNCEWGELFLYQPEPSSFELAPAAAPSPTPKSPPSVTPSAIYSSGARINLGQILAGAQAVDIAIFYSERSPNDPYFVQHVVNDPDLMKKIIASLDRDQVVGGVPACIADVELRFRLADGRTLLFGYQCTGKGASLFRGRSADGSLAIEGEVPVSDDFSALIAPAIGIAEFRRPNNTPPQWLSRIEQRQHSLDPFTLDEYLILDPGGYAPYQFEWMAITPEWVYQKNAAYRIPEKSGWPIPPVQIAGHEIAVAEDWQQTQNYAVVTRDGAEIYRLETRPPAGSSPIRGLWAWQNRWVLEVEGHIVVDGQDLGQNLGAQETFDWQIMAGKPFYFFIKDGIVNAMYGDQLLSLGYDAVVHDTCCEAGAFDVGHNDHMVWFYAKKDDIWRYAELLRK